MVDIRMVTRGEVGGSSWGSYIMHRSGAGCDEEKKMHRWYRAKSAILRNNKEKQRERERERAKERNRHNYKEKITLYDNVESSVISTYIP